MSSNRGVNIARRRPSARAAVDPRFLIAGFAMTVAAAFVIPGTPGLAAVFLYLLILHGLSGFAPSAIARAGKVVGPFVVLVIAINAVLVEGEPWIPGLGFVSREGVASGVEGAARVLVLYLAGAIFLEAAGPEDLARGISGLIRPVSRGWAESAGMHVFLSFGFLPVFAEEIRRIAVAQRFRGGGLEGGVAGKLRGARLLMVPLIISAVHRSDQLAATVELRRVRERMGSILVLEKASRKDYVFLAVTAAVMAGAWILS